MALLRNERTGRTIALGARVLVGRSGSCALQLDSRMVSNEHASLWWEGDAWLVRDVGSRNGTRLNGRLLEAGERARMHVDAVLVFGSEEHTWCLIDASAPVAIARSAAGRIEAAHGGVLSLPDVEVPEVMVFEATDGEWVVESAEGERRVKDGAPVVVQGEAWILHLPHGDTATWSPGLNALAIATIGLRFRVSLDEEYIEIAILHGAQETRLQTRAHFELLLTLARARLEDAGHPAAERGWRYADAVQRSLGLESAAFNLYIFRARQQFGDAAVAGAANLIERRQSTGQLRIGVERIEILPLGEG